MPNPIISQVKLPSGEIYDIENSKVLFGEMYLYEDGIAIDAMNFTEMPVISSSNDMCLFVALCDDDIELSEPQEIPVFIYDDDSDEGTVIGYFAFYQIATTANRTAFFVLYQSGEIDGENFVVGMQLPVGALSNSSIEVSAEFEEGTKLATVDETDIYAPMGYIWYGSQNYGSSDLQKRMIFVDKGYPEETLPEVEENGTHFKDPVMLIVQWNLDITVSDSNKFTIYIDDKPYELGLLNYFGEKNVTNNSRSIFILRELFSEPYYDESYGSYVPGIIYGDIVNPDSLGTTSGGASIASGHVLPATGTEGEIFVLY